ncbi:MAG: FkbM family methyltransferase [Roseibium sp.]|nr:FkbM family methyltransferase [Roseibium sp.]
MHSHLETANYRLISARHGRFLVNPNDMYIGRSLIEYGEFSEIEVGLINQLLPAGGVAVEVGANIGAMTVPMAEKVGRGGLIYAFEPQVLVFQQLCANLALNDTVNVAAFNAGCGAAEGRLPVARFDPQKPNNFGGITLDRMRDDTSPIPVRLETLDGLLVPHRLDLIKCDVEGMELDVLRGADRLIKSFKPALYLENHLAEKSRDLIQHIADLGYTCWWHLPPLFNKENHARNGEDIFGNIVSFNMMCLPAGDARNVVGLRPVSGPDDHPKNWN